MQHLQQGVPVGRDLLVPQPLHLGQTRFRARTATDQIDQRLVRADHVRRPAFAVCGLAPPPPQPVVQRTIPLVHVGQHVADRLLPGPVDHGPLGAVRILARCDRPLAGLPPPPGQAQRPERPATVLERERVHGQQLLVRQEVPHTLVRKPLQQRVERKRQGRHLDRHFVTRRVAPSPLAR